MGQRKKKETKKNIFGTIVAIIILIIVAALSVDSSFADSEVLATIKSQAENILFSQSNRIEFVAEDNLKVYFIDVGQADSILLVNKDKTMLIDAGNNDDGNKVVDFIKNKGITQLDYVVGTHPHEDHIGGLDDVINSFDVKNVFMPNVQTTTKTFKDVMNAVKNKKLKIKAPEVGYKFDLGEANCEVMSIGTDSTNLNTTSIVIRVVFGNESFLFTGDAETSNENAREWPKTTVLKVGHHGSSTSSSQEFLSQVKPEISIIMCEKGNDYGHPHKEVLSRLKKIGTTIYRTDKQGTIEIETDGNELNIKTEK